MTRGASDGAVRIETIPLGVDNCYLLQGPEGRAVLIDAGQPGRARGFSRALGRLGVDPRRIELLLLTHAHWDHIGCAAAIRELTGATVAIHASERERLEQGTKAMPRGVTGWGKVFGALLRAALPLVKLPPTPVDRVVQDDGLALAEYGIPGRVMHTPGHSPGSLSVVLDSGEAFVGDMAMSMRTLRWRPGLPIFAEQPERVRGSWCRLLDEHAIATIYPAHGRPFPAEVMRRAVS